MILRAVRTWLLVYPVATLIVGLIGAHVHGWRLPLRTMATSLLIVPIVVGVSTSLVDRLLFVLRRFTRLKSA
jgi:antibiotic biosynthesis monooxygenase (ABM) superfamily enzyme